MLQLNSTIDVNERVYGIMLPMCIYSNPSIHDVLTDTVAIIPAVKIPCYNRSLMPNPNATYLNASPRGVPHPLTLKPLVSSAYPQPQGPLQPHSRLHQTRTPPPYNT